MDKQSFTLIELLVVIAIIGILAGIIVVSMGGASNSARDAVRKADVNQLSKALAIYRTNNPDEDLPIDECNIGETSGGSDPCSPTTNNLFGTASTLKDPSDGYYVYESVDGDAFTITSAMSDSSAYSFDSATGTYSQTGGGGTGGGTLSCSTGWVEIPGTSNCVMKYEAKIQGNDNGNQVYDTAFVVESRPSGTPWVNANQIQAKAECAAIGAHLITNDEWMLVARDIENNPTPNKNAEIYYTGNSYLNYSLGALAASADDNDGYYGTGVTVGFNFDLIESAYAIPASYQDGMDGRSQRRTLKLSNNQTIWDFSGNAPEWVDATLEKNVFPVFDYVTGWGDFDQVTDWGGLGSWDNIGPSNHSLSNGNNNGVGVIRFDRVGEPADPIPSGGTTYAYMRGSDYSNGYVHGIYALDIRFAPEYDGTNWVYPSFRCVKPKA